MEGHPAVGSLMVGLPDAPPWAWPTKIKSCSNSRNCWNGGVNRLRGHLAEAVPGMLWQSESEFAGIGGLGGLCGG